MFHPCLNWCMTASYRNETQSYDFTFYTGCNWADMFTRSHLFTTSHCTYLTKAGVIYPVTIYPRWSFITAHVTFAGTILYSLLCQSICNFLPREETTIMTRTDRQIIHHRNNNHTQWSMPMNWTGKYSPTFLQMSE